MEDTETLTKLRFAELAPNVWKKLGEIPRTGWVMRGIKNAETVLEHTLALRDFVIEHRTKLTEFSDEDINDLLDMLEIHDWPESITGDEVIINKTKEEEQRLKEIKFEKELGAMKEICGGLGEKGKEILELWLRFERKEDEVSKFAAQVDKYQAAVQANRYESSGEGEVGLTERFVRGQSKYINHPFLLSQLASLKAENGRIKA